MNFIVLFSYSIANKRYEIAKDYFLAGKSIVTELNIASLKKDAAIKLYTETIKKYWIDYYNVRLLTLYDFESNTKILLDKTLVTK